MAVLAIGLVSFVTWSLLDRGANRSIDGSPARTLGVVRTPSNWSIDYMTWVPAKRALVVRALEGPLHLSTMIYLSRIDRARPRWQALSDLARLGCRDPALVSPVATGRSSFAFIEGCLSEREPPQEAKRIRQYRLGTRVIQTLYPYGLPFPAAGFALEPGGRRGVLNDGTGLQERLRWLRPRSLSAPIPLALDRVGDPRWSPNGAAVVFPGVVGLENVVGPARSRASRWAIYVADMRLTQLRRIGQGTFYEQPSLAWSPDGSVIAVAGKVRSGQGELALVRPRDGRTLVLRKGRYGAVTWTSRSKLGVVLHRDYAGRGGDVIESLDVTDGIQQLLRAR